MMRAEKKLLYIMEDMKGGVVCGYCWLLCSWKEWICGIQRGKGDSDIFKITDGFHDRTVNGIDAEKYCKVRKEDIDLEKIISRMRGARPWHPLLDLLRKECIA